MKKIMLLAALAACRDPGAVERADVNRAEDYATTLNVKVTCQRWGRSHDGDVDAALCKLDDRLFICTAGVTQTPRCDFLTDLNADRAQKAAKEAAQKAAQSPAPAPAQMPPGDAGAGSAQSPR